MKAAWTSPSNIALVKYWGKRGNQLPQNASISFTLKNAVTELSISAQKLASQNKLSLDFWFESSPNLKFKEKIEKFLITQTARFPWLLNHHLEIHSSNTFPHSSGIASSASSMSALNLCLLSLDELYRDKKYEQKEFFSLASELSRLGSGSASRSVYGGIVSWGNVSENYATPFSDAHAVFNNYCDSILIVDEGTKSVSSRAGHGLMENHPFKDERYKIASANFTKIAHALKSGNIESFIEVVEEEALMLHAMMMTSRPSYILLKPQSLLLIEKIRAYRTEKSIPVCFTIDAGPNIHLLYPKSHETLVRKWIDEELAVKCIHDEMGSGPINIEARK